MTRGHVSTCEILGENDRKCAGKGLYEALKLKEKIEPRSDDIRTSGRSSAL